MTEDGTEPSRVGVDVGVTSGVLDITDWTSLPTTGSVGCGLAESLVESIVSFAQASNGGGSSTKKAFAGAQLKS